MAGVSLRPGSRTLWRILTRCISSNKGFAGIVGKLISEDLLVFHNHLTAELIPRAALYHTSCRNQPAFTAPENLVVLRSASWTIVTGLSSHPWTSRCLYSSTTPSLSVNSEQRGRGASIQPAADASGIIAFPAAASTMSYFVTSYTCTLQSRPLHSESICSIPFRSWK
jgi:hypothetical protein